MPICEFTCSCGQTIEKFLKNSTETTKCPSCGGKMKRVLSASNFQLKGSGWAKDSYGLKEQKKKSNKPKKEK